jgi:hypothetical protein
MVVLVRRPIKVLVLLVLVITAVVVVHLRHLLRLAVDV